MWTPDGKQRKPPLEAIFRLQELSTRPCAYTQLSTIERAVKANERHAEVTMPTVRQAFRFSILVVCLALFIYGTREMVPFTPDDAFISFRYSENLAAGHGLAFNAGEAPVEGYSNFLWVLFGSLIAICGKSVRHWSTVMGIVLGALSVVCMWFIVSRRASGRLTLLTTMLTFSLSGPFILYSVSGLETNLFGFGILLIIASLELFLTTQRTPYLLLIAILGFVAHLCRPEGILIFPVSLCLLLVLNHSHERVSRGYFSSILLFSVLTLSYNVWRIWYFGELLPTPFLSKGGGASLLANWHTNLQRYFAESYPFGYYFAILAWVAIAAVACSGRRTDELRLEICCLVLFAVYVVVYFNFVDWMPGMRYQVGVFGLLLVPLRVLAVDDQGAGTASQPNSGRMRGVVVPVILIMITAFSYSIARSSKQVTQAYTVNLASLGTWLGRTMPPNALFAIGDAGAAPYYSGLRTLDINLGSLTDANIARNGYSKEYFFERKPDVVAFITARSCTEPRFNALHADTATDPRFTSAYRLIGVKRAALHDRCYWIYIRDSIRLTDDQLASFPAGFEE